MTASPFDHEAFWATEGLFVIADAIKGKRGDPDLLVNASASADFECDTFTMRQWCACAGVLHSGGCPSNFAFRVRSGTFEIRWEKMAGNRQIANMPKPPGMAWELAVAQCIQAVDQWSPMSMAKGNPVAR